MAIHWGRAAQITCDNQLKCATDAYNSRLPHGLFCHCFESRQEEADGTSYLCKQCKSGIRHGQSGVTYSVPVSQSDRTVHRRKCGRERVSMGPCSAYSYGAVSLLTPIRLLQSRSPWIWLGLRLQFVPPSSTAETPKTLQIG